VAVDGLGNAFVVGRTDGGTLSASTGPVGWANVFLAKYSPSGALEWVRQIGTDDGQDAYGVAVGPDVDIVIAGHTEDTMPGSSEAVRGGSDVFVAKLDTSGMQLWIRQFGPEQNDNPNAITVRPVGRRRRGRYDGGHHGRSAREPRRQLRRLGGQARPGREPALDPPVRSAAVGLRGWCGGRSLRHHLRHGTH